ncbi:MAG: MBG domain-containing protein [Verrucomicrobiota bacterium]
MFARLEAASSSADYSILYSSFLGGGTTSASANYQADVSFGDFGASSQSADGVYSIATGPAGQSSLIVPSVTWNSPGPIVYGTALSSAQLNASSSVSGMLTYLPQAGTVLNAGPQQILSVTFIPTDTASYSSVTVTVRIDVQKAPLTITAENKTMRQGDPLPAFTATFNGFVNGDTPGSLDSPPTLATTATPASPSGAYPIIVSGAVSANYTITYVTGTLTITAISELPVITVQPASQAAVLGTDVILRVVVEGLGPFQYQWFKEERRLTGENDSVLTLRSVGTEAAGSYTIEIRNAAGPVTSQAAVITVHALISQLRWDGAGIRFLVTVPAGRQGRIDQSEDLQIWNRVTPQPITGQFQFQDSPAAESRYRFYRVTIE